MPGVPRPNPPLDPRDLAGAVEGPGDAWEDLRGARLLLTGCTGFFGAWLLETLLHVSEIRKLGLEVVLLSRDPGRFKRRMPHLAGHRAVILWKGDIRSFAPPPGPITHLVHGAVASGGLLYQQDPGELRDILEAGTRHALEWAGREGVARVLFVSSGAVYGTPPPDGAGLSEERAPAPLTVYACGKDAAERMCQQYALVPGRQISIARCFAFLGPHLPLDLHFAAGNFIRDALEGGPVRVEGNGTAVRTYLYGSDLACWLWTILLRGANGRTYNVGSDRSVTIAELARAVAKAAGCGVVIEGRSTSDGKASHYAPNTDRARTELGLQVTVDLEEAILRTLAWHRPGWG